MTDDSRKVRDGVRRGLDTPEAKAMRDRIAAQAFAAKPALPVRMAVVDPNAPFTPKGNLKNWQYEALLAISNKYKMTQAEHDTLLQVAERAYDDGHDSGYGWGEDASRDRISELENELEGHRRITQSHIIKTIRDTGSYPNDGRDGAQIIHDAGMNDMGK